MEWSLLQLLKFSVFFLKLFSKLSTQSINNCCTVHTEIHDNMVQDTLVVVVDIQDTGKVLVFVDTLNKKNKKIRVKQH